MDIRTYLQQNTLLFDGAMGTYCAARLPEAVGTPCELLNLTNPCAIADIHKKYIDAGSMALRTNTFGANRLSFDEETCRQVINAGWSIAKTVAGEKYVFADIGPVASDSADPFAEYRFVIEAFLDLGAECFSFETNSRIDGLLESAEYIKKRNKNAFVLLSFAAQPDGFTRTGERAAQLIAYADACDAVDAVGLNCVSGARHMSELTAELGYTQKYFSAMPNAGYPTVLGNRTFFDSSPDYFASQLSSMAAGGARLIGGCCGTTPEYIAEAAKALKGDSAVQIAPSVQRSAQAKPVSELWEALCDNDRRPFAVELDPPDTADIEKFMQGAAQLNANGASAITIADCPIARARMDSSLLACKLHRELGVETLPHMTCRDRNLNAIKALLLGLSAEGVHNVLAVTGDPVPTAERDEVKSVYNFNSRMLARYIDALGEQHMTVPFNVFGALNVNARNFDIQLELAQQKVEKGMCGFLTQPILTPQAFENLKRARNKLGAKILGGIIPIVSYRNACFMNSEVAGVRVDDRVIKLYEGVDRQQGEKLAVDISAAIAKEIAPYVDGYYLITPFGRTALVCKIMKAIRELGLC